MERGLGTRWFQGVLNCYFQHHVVRKMKIMIMVVAYFTATSGSRWGGECVSSSKLLSGGGVKREMRVWR